MRFVRGYMLLFVLFLALPLTQYIFFQMIYPLAAVGMGIYLYRTLYRGGDGRGTLTVCLALWLFVVPVLLAGWQLLLFGSLRHNFYNLFHRYGSLTAMLAVPFILLPAGKPGAGEGSRARLADAAALLLATVFLVMSVVYGFRLSREFAAQRIHIPNLPVRVDMAEAKPGLERLPGELVTSSKSCSSVECHKILYDQWASSPHRLAGKTEPYKALIRVLAKEKGPEAVVFCSRCHTPLIAMAGLVDDPDDPSQDALRNEGISCQYCHIIDEVRHPPANGYVTVEFGRDYLADYGMGYEACERDFQGL